MAQYVIDNMPSPIEWEIPNDDHYDLKRTLQNAKNLLMCSIGEIPYDRNRGFNTDLLHWPIAKMRANLVKELDYTMMWEPDVEVVTASATMNDKGEVLVRVVLEIDFD